MMDGKTEADLCSKVYIVDTSVLLHDPDAILVLGKDRDNLVVVPICVLEELDHIKRDTGEKGLNARQVARLLDDLRQNGTQSLQSGVRISPTQGVVLVDHNGHGVKKRWPDLDETRDNRILVIGDDWQKKETERGRKVKIVTKDITMRLKADAVGIPANDYTRDRAVEKAAELYTGWAEIKIADPSEMDVLSSLAQEKEIPATRLAKSADLKSLFPNQGCQISCGDRYLLAVYKRAKGTFEYVPKPAKMDENGKIKPVNDRQALLYHMLCDPTITLVTVVGPAGTGKSLMAFAAGYEQFKRDAYRSLLIYKPIVEVGERTLGFLPGDLQEKMDPWESAIFDSLNLILGNGNGKDRGDRSYSARDIVNEFRQKGLMEIAPLSHIRGRSLNHSLIVVEETQNLTPHEVKAIVTRLATGSKIVLVGDVEQIDNPYLNATSTGLSRAVEITKGSELAGHMTLTECRRMPIAALFANLM